LAERVAYGWALTNQEHQSCPKCGAKLEIHQEKSERKPAGAAKLLKLANIFLTEAYSNWKMSLCKRIPDSPDNKWPD